MFDVHVTMHRVKFLIIKPTRCTNLSNLFLKLNSTCFGQFLHPSSGVFHCTHSSGICHTGLLTACEQDQDETAVPDDGQRNCPKHVEFNSKNKFDKLVHLVGFIIRNCIVFFSITTVRIYAHAVNLHFVRFLGFMWHMTSRNAYGNFGRKS